MVRPGLEKRCFEFGQANVNQTGSACGGSATATLECRVTAMVRFLGFTLTRLEPANHSIAHLTASGSHHPGPSTSRYTPSRPARTHRYLLYSPLPPTASLHPHIRVEEATPRIQTLRACLARYVWVAPIWRRSAQVTLRAPVSNRMILVSWCGAP